MLSCNWVSRCCKRGWVDLATVCLDSLQPLDKLPRAAPMCKETHTIPGARWLPACPEQVPRSHSFVHVAKLATIPSSPEHHTHLIMKPNLLQQLTKSHKMESLWLGDITSEGRSFCPTCIFVCRWSCDLWELWLQAELVWPRPLNQTLQDVTVSTCQSTWHLSVIVKWSVQVWLLLLINVFILSVVLMILMVLIVMITSYLQTPQKGGERRGLPQTLPAVRLSLWWRICDRLPRDCLQVIHNTNEHK